MNYEISAIEQLRSLIYTESDEGTTSLFPPEYPTDAELSVYRLADNSELEVFVTRSPETSKEELRKHPL